MPAFPIGREAHLSVVSGLRRLRLQRFHESGSHSPIPSPRSGRTLELSGSSFSRRAWGLGLQSFRPSGLGWFVRRVRSSPSSPVAWDVALGCFGFRGEGPSTGPQTTSKMKSSSAKTHEAKSCQSEPPESLLNEECPLEGDVNSLACNVTST